MSAGLHVVIVDSHIKDFGDSFAQERAAWEALGATVTLAACRTEEELIAAGREADVLAYLGLYTPFTARVLANLPRCRLIARFGIGMDSVDLAAATAQGIVVSNAAEYCVPEVATHTAALILATERRLMPLDAAVRDGQWPADRVVEPTRRLSALTLGIVGLGRIGRRVATYLKPFMGTMVASDPYLRQSDADPFGVRLTSLEEVLASSDYVTLHTPLNPETRGLIGPAQFAHMKPTAFLVNTSRGPVVDEPALVEALQTGRLAGAALDVFTEEPLPLTSPLRTLPGVILTPHAAYYSRQSMLDLRREVTATVAAVLRGEWPRHQLNPTVNPRVPLTRA